MGNVYDSPDRTDRSYGRGGQLREDKKWRYYYDSHGNLVLKTMRRSGPSLDAGMRDKFLQWQSGDYAYTWQGNGMLRSVTRPDGKTVAFKYDALGRRIEKVFDGRVYRYLWDGDVILHEWDYAEADRPNTVVTETGEITFDRPEPVENLITWVYDSDSYVPTAKIVGDRRYSIISDYIGRPVQAYDDNGNIVWQSDYDIYGNLRNLHGSRQFIPFRQLGQYEDEETGLYYNRFRYYDPRIGNYISQDPIRLAGGNPTLYAFVCDTNIQKDQLGLTVEGRSTNVVISTGADANATMPGYSPPYKPNAKVTEFTTMRDEVFVRVHGAENKCGPWMMHEAAIRGLSPEQIKAKFNLPDTPTHVSTVTVPAGTRMRSGKVNPLPEFGGVDMNAKQFQLLERIPNENFGNTKKIKSYH